MTARTVNPARAIPWDDMTDEQKRDHLIFAHKTNPWEVAATAPLDGATWVHDADHQCISRKMLHHTHDKDPR